MNKKIETQKIKVNNGQELITKAKEYKNSGGKWKLLERYNQLPAGTKRDKKKLGWGIIISNGEQTADIFSTKNNLDKNSPLDEVDARPELFQLFPETKSALFGNSKSTENLDTSTFKLVKEASNEYRNEYNLYRYLVAENSWHLKKILGCYVRDNETKIYQSANPHFSGWVEIIDGQDGNMYLYVGEKNENGGREIKIGIKKEEFEKGDFGEDGASKTLEGFWELFTFNRPLNPTEKENSYRSLEEEFQGNWPHREKLCRKYWERIVERMKEAIKFFDTKEQGHNYQLAFDYIEHCSKINKELKENNKIKTCCDKECSHYLPIKDSPRHNPSPTLPPSAPKSNQISPTDKNKLLQFFLTHHVKKIAFENGKLVVEYNNQDKKVAEMENRELQQYRQLIQSQPNQSLSLTDLQTNINPSTSNQENNNLYKGLAVGVIGGVILIGIIVYSLSHRRKKEK